MLTTETNTQDHSTRNRLTNLWPTEVRSSPNSNLSDSPAPGVNTADSPPTTTDTSDAGTADLIHRITESLNRQQKEHELWFNGTFSPLLNAPGQIHKQNRQYENNGNNIRYANGQSPHHNQCNNNGQNNSFQTDDRTANPVANMEPATNNEYIIQWNVNGFILHIDEVKLLIEEYEPTVLCLQETRIKTNERVNLTGYRMYQHRMATRQRGVAVAVRRDTTAEKINLVTDLNAVAVRVGFDRPTTVCSLYVAPSQNPTLDELTDLANQLPPPFIITGDINAHNPIWGSRTHNQRGRIFERFVEEKGLVILNTGEMTHYSSAYGTLTAIDLTVATAELALELDWHVVNDLHNSDHYPTITSVTSTKSTPTLRRRWILETANWKKFRGDVKNKLQGGNPNMKDITDAIREAAFQNIKKTSGKPPKRTIRWMTDELRDLIRQRRRAERRLRNHKTDENLMDFQRLKATTRLLLKRARQEEWRRFTNTMTNQTPAKEIWGKISAISGKRKSCNIPRIRTNDQAITQPLQIANSLARHFAKISKTNNYSTAFQDVKSRAEKTAVQVNFEDEAGHNSSFSMTELQEALSTCLGSSPGPDDITYEMIKQLEEAEKGKLLKAYNDIWETGTFPEEWRQAVTIPIKKPGKDPESVDSYRPISLTSCLGKVLEKMVNRRLVFILEKGRLLPEQQFGFRKGKSTADVLNILQSKISESFLKKEHLALVSLDLSKAYDTCWRYGIIRWLKEHQIDGRLLQYIVGFLQNRSMKTMVGSQESEEVVLENGVPQGAVLSVTLFLIAISDICKSKQPNVEMIGYADDWYVFTSQKHIKDAEPIIQRALDNIERWTQKTGFRISVEKTKSIIFTKSSPRNGRHTFDIQLNNQAIEEVTALKILGLTFDSKLTWKTHIKDTKARAKKRLNILRCLAGTEWGADRDILLRTHHAIVLATLRYGETAYGSAKPNILKQLEPVHNAGLRIAIGAFCVTRTSEVLKEAGVKSLMEIRNKALAISGIRTRSKHSHPLRHHPDTQLQEIAFQKPNLPAPYSVRVDEQLQQYNINHNNIHQDSNWELEPWTQLDDCVLDTDMVPFSKKNPAIIKSHFNRQLTRYHFWEHTYTDGSKSEEGVGYSAHSFFRQIKVGLPRITSVFTAEASAIYDAGKEKLEEWEQRLILTDSLSTVQAIDNNNKNPLIQKIVKQLYDGGGKLVIKWIPGHSDIEGNEIADKEAKEAASSRVSSTTITPEDAIAHIKREFDNNITKQHMPKNITRKEQVAVARWRMGYTRETHKHLLESPEPKTIIILCDKCDLPRTCQHLLLHCTEHNLARLTTGLTDKYRDGSEIEAYRLLLYLRETGLLLKG
jgi:ribonuclease HI